jgi:hypothetical protein
MEVQQQTPKLLDQVGNVLRLHHYSIHRDVAPTMIYTHVVQPGGQGVPSPLDDLE